MSLNVAALEILVAKGLSAEDILEVARALEIKKDPTAAERKRRQRTREADERDMSHLDVTRDAPLSLPPNEKISNPPTHTPENITPARKEPRPKNHNPAKPDDVSDQTWADFLTHRRAKRAPVSETVIAGIRREAVKAGWTMDAALAETVTRGWQSFRADWAAPHPVSSSAAPGSFLAHLVGQSP